jgi:hypothetical protein
LPPREAKWRDTTNITGWSILEEGRNFEVNQVHPTASGMKGKGSGCVCAESGADFDGARRAMAMDRSILCCENSVAVFG